MSQTFFSNLLYFILAKSESLLIPVCRICECFKALETFSSSGTSSLSRCSGSQAFEVKYNVNTPSSPNPKSMSSLIQQLHLCVGFIQQCVCLDLTKMLKYLTAARFSHDLNRATNPAQTQSGHNRCAQKKRDRSKQQKNVSFLFTRSVFHLNVVIIKDFFPRPHEPRFEFVIHCML